MDPGPSGAVRSGAVHALKRFLTVWRLFDRRAKRGILLIAVLLLGAAVLEAIGAGLILPFIALMTDVTYLDRQPLLGRLYRASGLANATQFSVAAALFLFVFFLAKNLYLAFTTFAQFRLLYREMSRFSTRLYEGYLRAGYEFHLQTNSAILVRNVSNDVLQFFTHVLSPGLILVSEALVVLGLLTVLIWLAAAPALIAALLLGALTLAFYALVRRRVRRYGTLQQTHYAERVKWINQGFQGIKEVKVLAKEPYFAEAFRLHEHAFADASRFAMVLNQMPRLFIEALAFSALFLGVALMYALDATATQAALPTLALFAVAAVRLLPSVNRIMNSVTRISYYRPSIDVVCCDLQAAPASAPTTAAPRGRLPFTREIRGQGVWYWYPTALAPAVQDLSFAIPRNASVALVGPSGAGKTTVADLLLGLLKPSRGTILVDGVDIHADVRAWQAQIGYIPQSIFLSDDSIRRNVAFGVPDNQISDGDVWEALRAAQLADHVERLPQRLDTLVGERGVSLSGGQRQRIGIARALYHRPELLVLDEATSALDEETEQAIAEAIDQLAGRRTLIIIAHRPTTIRKCNVRIELQAGRLAA